jgi:hypothetical protein
MEPLPYLPAAIALVVCLACRRHAVLLWLGGLLVVGTGLLIIHTYVGLHRVQQPTGDHYYVAGLVVYLSASITAAGVVLVVGGLVRWGQARG